MMKRLLTVLFLAGSLISFSQNKHPYPIIFIHGLNSNADTWTTFLDSINIYGLKKGGTMNFCLNYDGNSSTANFQTDYKDFTQPNTLIPGDYYFLNFDVDRFGNYMPGTMTSVESNQQAIFKQGRAVRDAIQHVLSITGKDKVILVGHSMGGLASREYLSNSSIWQPDAKHHVAKLFTTATPHGGSNTSLGAFSGPLSGVNDLSEAVRDLRTSYYYLFLSNFTGFGVHNFGGQEKTSVIYYSPFSNYNNVDVNCNGVVNETITGLYYKSSPTDIYYSCAMGKGTGLLNGTVDAFANTDGNGDGVVGFNRANMNNYMYLQTPLVFSADTFVQNEAVFTEFHTEMPDKLELNMRGLDEPTDPDLAYAIDTNKTYLGWVTAQSGSSTGYHTDYDSYTFDVKAKNSIRVNATFAGGNIVFAIAKNSTILHQIFMNKTVIDTLLDVDSVGDHFFIMGLPAIRGFIKSYRYKLSLVPFLSIVNQPVSQTVCGNGFTTFTVSVTGKDPFTYQWSNGSLSSSMTTSIAGSYLVTITGAADTKISNVATLTKVDCTPVIAVQPTSQTICGSKFATINVSATGYASNMYSYAWNNGNTSNSINTSIPGNYLVTVTGLSNYKAISNIAILTTVDCMPVITIQPVSQTICGNDLATFNVSAAGFASNLYSYVWNNGITSNSISTSIPGNYLVTVTGKDNFKSISNVATLTGFNCIPTIIQQPISKTICGETFSLISVSVSGIGDLTYFWNNGITSNYFNTSIAGVYIVTITGLNNYVAISDTAMLTTIACNTTPSTINSIRNEVSEGIEIYPNPVNETLNLSIKASAKEYQIDIFNEIGTLVLSSKANSPKYSIDTKNLRSGLYFIKVSWDQKYETSKILKQ